MEAIIVGTFCIVVSLLIQGMLLTRLWSLDGGEYFLVLLGTLTLFFGLSTLFIGLASIKPSAIDVYRGKTTLEITYRDSIPVDSTVVFK